MALPALWVIDQVQHDGDGVNLHGCLWIGMDGVVRIRIMGDFKDLQD